MHAAFRPVVAAVALAAAVTACGSSAKSGGSTTSGSSGGSSAAAAGGASGNAVMIKNFAYNPTPLDVKVGTTVTWTNSDGATHTVSSSDKSFDSGDLSTGKNFSYTFKSAGTFKYICDIHQYMNGTVVVK